MTDQNEVYSMLKFRPQDAEKIMQIAVREDRGWLQHGAVFRCQTGKIIKCNISPCGEFWYTDIHGKSDRLEKPVEFLYFDEAPSGIDFKKLSGK